MFLVCVSINLVFSSFSVDLLLFVRALIFLFDLVSFFYFCFICVVVFCLLSHCFSVLQDQFYFSNFVFVLYFVCL